jgi:hypothetical protein
MDRLPAGHAFTANIWSDGPHPSVSELSSVGRPSLGGGYAAGSELLGPPLVDDTSVTAAAGASPAAAFPAAPPAPVGRQGPVGDRCRGTDTGGVVRGLEAGLLGSLVGMVGSRDGVALGGLDGLAQPVAPSPNESALLRQAKTNDGWDAGWTSTVGCAASSGGDDEDSHGSAGTASCCVGGDEDGPTITDGPSASSVAQGVVGALDSARKTSVDTGGGAAGPGDDGWWAIWSLPDADPSLVAGTGAAGRPDWTGRLVDDNRGADSGDMLEGLDDDRSGFLRPVAGNWAVFSSSSWWFSVLGRHFTVIPSAAATSAIAFASVSSFSCLRDSTRQSWSHERWSAWR